LTSITVDTGTTIAGRALARNGDVTLDDNVFTAPTCATTTTVTTTASTAGGTTTLTAAVASGGIAVPAGGTVTFRSNGVVVGTAPVGANGIATLVVPVGSTSGTRTVTATFNGSSTLTPSTSSSTSLLVHAAPVLPDTGTSDIGTLIIIGAGTIAVGLALALTRRRRVPATG
jgi:LPXTG-motif cell wall-anchored protein